MTKAKIKMGRPRTVTPPTRELIELGKEMVKWVKENKPLHIKEFYSIHKGIIFKDWDAITQKSEFLPYYETAMGIVSLNYINGTVNQSIAHRFLRIYFKDVRQEEDLIKKQDQELSKEMAEFLHALRKENLETVSEEVKLQFDVLMNQITNMQRVKK